MRRRRPGKLRYLLIAAVLIIAMVAIIRMAVPEPQPDEHAGQVYLNDGLIWSGLHRLRMSLSVR